MNGIKYRPDIDGLRAVSVISVLIYHGDFFINNNKLFPGGFYGVDVFFVISGYLITSLFLKEYKSEGDINLLGFLVRRAKRILPIFFLVIASSILFSWFYLLPEQLIDFSKSILASIFFVSNFYWSITLQEYGAESSILKPLLHTWSLSIEEQFYIIFPIILLSSLKFLRKPCYVVIFLSLLVLISFCSIFFIDNSSKIFYYIISRFWELGLGAIVAFWVIEKKQNSLSYILTEALTVLGVGIIFFSVLTFDFAPPGIKTLFPIVGALLILLFSSNKSIVNRLLSSKLIVSIGLISYSLYMWHYPIFSFYHIYSEGDSSIYDSVLLIFLTAVLSILTYKVIEQPIRGMQSNILFFSWILFFLLLFFTYALSSINNVGFPERFSNTKELYGKNEFDNIKLRKKTNEYYRSLYKSGSMKNFELNTLFFSDDESTKKILVIGNSHAKNLFNAFHLNRGIYKGVEFAKFRIQVDSSEMERRGMYSSPNFIESDYIIISTSFISKERNDLMMLSSFISEIKSKGKKVVLMSNSPMFKNFESKTIFDKMILNKKSVKEINHAYFELKRSKVNELNQDLKRIAINKSIIFLEKSDFTCDQIDEVCIGVTPSGFKSHFDGEHYTLEGAKFFGQKIFELNWIQNLR